MKKFLFLAILSVIFLEGCNRKIIYTNEWHSLAIKYNLLTKVQFYSELNTKQVFTPTTGPKDSAAVTKRGKLVKIDFAGGEFNINPKTLGQATEDSRKDTVSVNYSEKYHRRVAYAPKDTNSNTEFKMVSYQYIAPAPKKAATKVASKPKPKSLAEQIAEMDQNDPEEKRQEAEEAAAPEVQDGVRLSDQKLYFPSSTVYLLYFSKKSLTKPLESTTAKGTKVRN